LRGDTEAMSIFIAGRAVTLAAGDQHDQKGARNLPVMG